MSLGTDMEHTEQMVVLVADGDDRERREMAAVLRSLARAMDEQDYVGNSLLVLEQRCYERLLSQHRRAAKAAGDRP